MIPNHVLLIDIDGLRADVFNEALQAGHLPNIAQLLGGKQLERGLELPVLSSAPSITFCAQASLLTGTHPKAHGIPGNQFFDRFGIDNNNVPRLYAFDVGEMLKVLDGLAVFTDALAAKRLESATIYEKMAQKGWRSTVAGHMYAEGATHWLKPSLIDLGRFFACGEILGLESAEYDERVLDNLLEHIKENGLDNITTMYFLGLDYESHDHGPDAAQADYLINHVDPMVGKLWQTVRGIESDILAVLFSDHGQVETIAEEQYALYVGFPFGGELGQLFEALDLDLYTYPGQGQNCNAVMTLNGKQAYVYLQKKSHSWADAPQFERDVLSVGQAFWKAHDTGKHAPDLENALGGVLVRNVERDGWHAPYQALTPDGHLISLEEWFAQQPADLYIDPVNRLNQLINIYCGDVMLISNFAAGYYFGHKLSGVHGGLHPHESRAMLAYGWPNATEAQWQAAKKRITQAIRARCQAENDRHPSIVDMVTGLEALLDMNQV